MNHLDIDDIIKFVSIKEFNDENIELAKKVNKHIRECEKCIKLVRAFQMLHDEFVRLQNKQDFEKYVKSALESRDISISNPIENKLKGLDINI